tara:strand:- start:220 stop:606 length:387 start_codon:yes stop_codon:yes gene_type:complete
MTDELMYLSWVLGIQLVMWVPYVLNRILIRGLWDTLGYPENYPASAKWAERLQAAHYNSVENLVVFSALVLMAHVTSISNETTLLACHAYFWARLFFVISYTFAIPLGRTIAFAAGWICQIVLLLEII